MRLIVDIQGFKDEKNTFLPKELAAFDGHRISHYIFKKPYPLDFLSPECHRQAVWLMKNHHCINWNEGFTPHHYFSNIIEKLTEEVEVEFVYVKGVEKAAFVKKYSKKPVIEIDEQPALPIGTPKCFHHSKSTCMCALSNVLYLYDNFFMNE